MKAAAIVLLLAGCSFEPQGPLTYEVTPHERAGGTCGPGKPWVETLDKHSSAKHSYDNGDFHYEDLRLYHLDELTGYVEQTATWRYGGDPWCASVYDLTLEVVE